MDCILPVVLIDSGTACWRKGLGLVGRRGWCHPRAVRGPSTFDTFPCATLENLSPLFEKTLYAALERVLCFVIIFVDHERRQHTNQVHRAGDGLAKAPPLGGDREGENCNYFEIGKQGS